MVKAIFSFISVNWRFFLAVLIVAAIGLTAYTCENRGKKVDRLTIQADKDKKTIDGYTAERKRVNDSTTRLVRSLRLQLADRGDSLTDYRLIASDCQLREQQQENYIYRYQLKVDQAKRANTARVLGQTAQQQVAENVSNLQAVGALPSTYKPDLASVTADSTLRAGNSQASAWLVSITEKNDSLVKSSAVTQVRNDSLTRTNTGLQLANAQKDVKLSQKDAALDRLYDNECGGFFQRLFCKRCRELRRARK